MAFSLFLEMFTSLVSVTLFFSDIPLYRLIRFGVHMLPFPLFLLFLAVMVFEAVEVIHCKVN